MNFSPLEIFNNKEYQQADIVRFDNFNLLNIDFNGKTILELGSGIGNHTDFILSKKPKKIVSIEGQLCNFDILKTKFKDNKKVHTIHHNLELPYPFLSDYFDWVYNYGLLYHLKNPFESIDYLKNLAHSNMILETCIEFNGEENNLEEGNTPSQALNRIGSRPNKDILFEKLKTIYQNVYYPLQPKHEWFDIYNEQNDASLKRVVIICENKK
jgi:SAM-dependent methyltransferase